METSRRRRLLNELNEFRVFSPARRRVSLQIPKKNANKYWNKYWTSTGQVLDKYWTSTGRELDKRSTGATQEQTKGKAMGRTALEAKSAKRQLGA
jgi:hypothetical protein